MEYKVYVIGSLLCLYDANELDAVPLNLEGEPVALLKRVHLSA